VTCQSSASTMCFSCFQKFVSTKNEVSRGLLAEELVLGPGHGFFLNGEMLKEAQELWRSSSGWRLDVKGDPENGVPRIESCAVDGSYAESGIRIWRAMAEIPSSISRTTRLLASPEGQAILDPSVDHEKLCDAAETLEATSQEFLRVEHVFESVPMAPRKTSFVLLSSASVKNTHYFLSKSILHPSLPGHSKYYDPIGEDGSSKLPECLSDAKLAGARHNRGVQTLAILVESTARDRSPFTPVSLEPRCAVTFVRWKDLSLPPNCLHSSMDLTNRINKGYFKPFYARLLKKMAQVVELIYCFPVSSVSLL